MPKKQPMKPLRLYIPITRAVRTDDGAALFVEGYAYVNAVVGDGWNLKRSSMEAATPDYNEWGAVREMHQASAVGTATGVAVVDKAEIPLGVTWDDKGAFLRCLVVDEDAINKVERSVYKAFSVGIRVEQARGTDVEKCTWFENSLVDRPADKDATFDRFLLARADGVTDESADAENEAEVYEEGEPLPSETAPAAENTGEGGGDGDGGDDTVVRGVFAQKMGKRENSAKRGLAFDVLYDSLWNCVGDTGITDPEAAARECCREFEDYIAPLIGEAAAKSRQVPEEIYYGAGLGDDILKRFAEATGDAVSLRSERATLLSRVEALEGELAAARSEAETAQGETEKARGEAKAALDRAASLQAELNRLPDPNQPRPFRNIPSERAFLATREHDQVLSGDCGAGVGEKEAEAIRAEIAELTEKLPAEEDDGKRKAGVARLNGLKMRLQALGAA